MKSSIFILSLYLVLHSASLAFAGEIPDELRDKLWYAVSCPGGSPGFHSLLRDQWEREGRTFQKQFSSDDELSTYIRTRIEPYSNGIWRDILERVPMDRRFYEWIPGVVINKDFYKPKYLPDPNCDYLPLAARIQDRWIGATTALNGLSLFDQYFSMMAASDYEYWNKVFYTNWMYDSPTLTAVGNLLSDRPSLSQKDFYAASKIYKKGQADFYDCEFAGQSFGRPTKCSEFYDFSDSPLVLDEGGVPPRNWLAYQNVREQKSLLGMGETHFHPNGGIASVVLDNPRQMHEMPPKLRLRLSLVSDKAGRLFVDRSQSERLIFDENGNLRAAADLVRGNSGDIVYNSAAPEEVAYKDEDEFEYRYELGAGTIWKDGKGRILGGTLAKDTIVGPSWGHNPWVACKGSFATFSSSGVLRSVIAEKIEPNEYCGSGRNLKAELTLSKGEKILAESNTFHRYEMLSGLPDYGGGYYFSFEKAPATIESLVSYAGAPDCTIRRKKEDGGIEFRIPHNCFHFVRYLIKN